MTREDYLNKLKDELGILPQKDIGDAISYYSAYFSDTNDDEKIMNELGSPESLAKKIIENNQKKLQELSKEKNQQFNSEANSDALFFEFDKKDVKSLRLDFGMANVVLISGEKLSVETRGITSDFFNCNLNSSGILTINNQKKINFDFWVHGVKYRAIPRILITLPEDLSLEELKIRIGAGKLVSKNIKISCNIGYFDCESGHLALDFIKARISKIHCGIGNLSIFGEFLGKTEIDCGMGNIKLNLQGNLQDYSYDGKVGLGSFHINEIKKSGVGQINCDEKKYNHLSVNVGMGNVSVLIKNKGEDKNEK